MEQQRSNTFVLRTYRDKNAESYYEIECQMLRDLKRNAGAPKNIVNFLGSFEHLDTINLLFEYADRGSLEHFITNRQNFPPSSGEDIARFWAAVLEVTDGLRLIHTSPRPREEASSPLFRYSTCHVRVYRFTRLILRIAGTAILNRPTSFLLSSGGKSEYDLQFKISDFGAPHFLGYPDMLQQERDTSHCKTSISRNHAYGKLLNLPKGWIAYQLY